MNDFDLQSSYPDRTFAGPWDAQTKKVDKTPALANLLTKHGSELNARVTACYAELRALPRSTRRALQRQLARSSELPAVVQECLRHGGRRLQHRIAWSLAGAALLLALGQDPVTAATITVTTNNPNIAADGQCSLIEAIVNANNDAATHSDCPAGIGADTIVLPANANIALSSANGTLDHVTVGAPLITSVITLEGNGAIVNRQANASAFALLAVSTPGDLTLRAVTLSGGTQGGVYNRGKLNIQNSTISGHVGRGISNTNGTVTITNSAIVGNMGGGLYSAYGHLTIENSTISGNAANYFGGGIDISGGTTTIANSTISDNTSQGFGGGLAHGIGYYVPILLAITNSTISGNTAKGGGGGISNHGGVIAIANSTIANNLTKSRGGGLSNEVGFGGPGAFTIANSTISGNRANEGGGVFNERGCAHGPCLSAAITLSHSLITGNESASGREVATQGNDFTANNFNLFGYNGHAGVTGFTPGPTDIVPAHGVSLAQILGPLQNNGGPTQTHALVAGSPAVNAGNPAGCKDSSGTPVSTDQRGFPRPSNGPVCDIGAFESQAVICPGNSVQAALDVASPGDTVSVSGTCNENIVVRNEKRRIVLNGGGAAVINGVNPAIPTVAIRGKGILIQNFTITGGSSGIAVNRGSNAVIDNNLIQNTAGSGVVVDELAFSVITNNAIQNNPGAGIFVSESSTARIGFNNDTEISASTNTIHNNGLGVALGNGSSARIVGNTIDGNSGDGVQVLRDSQADLSANTINNNGGNGISISENSFIQLGEKDGTSIFEAINVTNSNNTGVGVSCSRGSVLKGRLGSLIGALGATNVAADCINALSP